MNEFEQKIHPTYQEVSRAYPAREELTQTPLERWLGGDYEPAPSSISSDSISPKIDRHDIDDTCESPSGNFLQFVEHGERELTTTASQTDHQDFLSTAAQTDALKKFEMIDLKDFISTGSQTDLLREIDDLITADNVVSTGSQTDLLRDIDDLITADKVEITEKDTSGDRTQRRRKSGVSVVPVADDRTTKPAIIPDGKAVKANSEASDRGKLNLVVEKERTATNLWRKKLSVAFKIPEEFESYSSATGQALEKGLQSSVGSSNFVDGVSLHVRYATLSTLSPALVVIEYSTSDQRRGSRLLRTLFDQ